MFDTGGGTFCTVSTSYIYPRLEQSSQQLWVWAAIGLACHMGNEQLFHAHDFKPGSPTPLLAGLALLGRSGGVQGLLCQVL